MKLFRLIAASAFFAAILAVPAFAQNTSKVALINSLAFDDPKTGITKYVAAFKNLETEFKPRQDEIVAIQNKLKAVSDAYQILLKNNGAGVVDQKSIEAKREEGEKLQLEFKYKEEQYKAAVQRRYEAVIGPVQKNIGDVLAEYAKSKGFQMMFDLGKDEKGMMIWADNAVDVTADFIKYFNSKPATTAAVTK